MGEIHMSRHEEKWGVLLLFSGNLEAPQILCFSHPESIQTCLLGMSLSPRTFQEIGILYQELWSKTQLEENLFSH